MNILRRYINETGLRVNFVAQKLNVSQACLTMLMKNERIPDLRMACLIEDFTRGQIKIRDWLVDEKKNENKKACSVQQQGEHKELELSVAQESR